MIGDIAHVCNRGVDKRRIFNSRENYERFRDNLLLLNNIEGKIRTKRKNIFNQSAKLPERDKLVEILKWSLMPNHFHLLLYEKVEGGILEFTKRLGNAYTKYFNLKVGERRGYLFQNSAKIITIGDEKHFSYLPIYIDLNAADLVSGDLKKKMKFLKTYEWSSLKNYCGDKKDVEIINESLFYEIFETNLLNYEKDLEGFLKDREKLESELYLKGVNLPG